MNKYLTGLNSCMQEIDLSKKSGLPIKLCGNELVFGSGLHREQENSREIAMMNEVLLEKGISEPKKTYFMHRGVCLEQDCKAISASDLRYDITVVPSGLLGKEFNKTFGHFHPKANGSELSFSEVYEVIHGKAHYLLQKEDNSNCFFVEAVAGQKVIVPPNFGHVTINPGKETLVMSNWVEKNFSSKYGPIKQKHGAMYFETLEGWEKNSNYDNIPELFEKKPLDFPEFGLVKEKPMYSLASELQKLAFLKNPLLLNNTSFF
jgi:glucose-6-phosphate isomerase, archaeal